MMKLRPLLALVALLASSAFSTISYAAATAQTEHASLSLLLDVSSEQPAAVIEFELEDHWHIYWKNPGDSGLEAQISWTLPKGITAGNVEWLPPKRIEYSGLFNYGYEGTTALTIPLNIADAANIQGASIQADVEFLICKDVCIPQSASLHTTVADNADAVERISEWRAQIPKPLVGHAEYDDVQENLHFGFDLSQTEIDLRRIYKGWLYPLDDQIISNAAEQEWRLTESTIIIAATKEGAKRPENFHGVLEISTTDGQKHYYNVAAEYSPISPTTNDPLVAETSNAVATTLLAAIISAFLGGIILNIMPCVLPVLSLKALSIAKKSDADHSALRLQGLAYTAGILITFLAVAGSLILLQQAGESIGWGFQLQSAGFVSILIYVLFLVGLNLSGMFEIPSSFAGVGTRFTQNENLSGSFFTGVLATVVATPCTAPFMATAVGFALSQPSYVALIVFAALGLGLAFPFLLITFVPGATRLLPKPGAWMERFKQFLAFPIYGTVIWLLWVLTQQSGAMGLLGTLIGLLAIGFTLWLLPMLRARLLQLIILLACAAVLIHCTETGMAGEVDAPAIKQQHEVFSPELLAQYREQGRAVFVDATAAWCITCKVNEKFALSDDSVLAAIKENNIAFLVADWTNRDDSITAYLKSFGRSGVPIYVYYAPNGGEPVLLPQLLTPSIVIDAFNQPN